MYLQEIVPRMYEKANYRLQKALHSKNLVRFWQKAFVFQNNPSKIRKHPFVLKSLVHYFTRSSNE